MTTTRAAVLRGHDRTFAVEDVELGPLRPDEILVRIAGVGMCHTDMMPRDPGFAARLGPVVLGHEGSGTVEQVGSAVTRMQVGDHVLLSFDSCGWCATCLLGAPAYCTEFSQRNMTGRRTDGTHGATDRDGAPLAVRWFGQSSFAEHAVATERNAVVVDRELPLELLGPLGCGLQTGAGAVLNEMAPSAGQSIAVFGAGAVGLAAVMAAKIAGAADIVVVDLVPGRLDLALELGATRTVPGDTDDVLARIVNGGPGVDFTLDTTGVPGVMRTAVACLARPGKAVLVGVGSKEVSVPPAMLAGRTLTFSLEGNSVPQLFLPKLLRFWERGLFPFEKLVRTYSLDDINQAESDAIAGTTVKPVLLPARR
ncbi:NAD(P)-dependent alcohol dehydrogenase [Streptomyces mirabilis]|uniref:NAD(P)-dependent alcohol dehydrogenase n=1 Tax=Streptomyces mirabilis TaxID=68239 RepID=UPI0033AE9DF3